MSDVPNRQGSSTAGSHGSDQSLVKLAVEVGPLILFFLANARPKLFEPLLVPFLPARILAGENAGLFTATFVLMVGVVGALVFSWARTRQVPVMPLVTTVLVLFFGALTLFLQDTTFIKMKPTILYCLFAATLYGGLLFDKLLLPVIFDRALDLTEKGWRILTRRWVGCFIALAVANEIVWRTQSNDVWVAFKFPGIFIILIVFSVAQVPLILRYKAAGAADSGVARP